MTPPVVTTGVQERDWEMGTAGGVRFKKSSYTCTICNSSTCCLYILKVYNWVMIPFVPCEPPPIYTFPVASVPTE